MNYPERLKCLTCGEGWFRAVLSAPGRVLIVCGECDRQVIDIEVDETEMPFAVMR